jgi:RNA polymerase sigma-B factor
MIADRNRSGLLPPRRGDREQLIERHIPLARALAVRYRRGSDPVDDLVQVACVGLVKAAERWDPTRGFAFSSYAVPTIRGELLRYFRDTTWAVRPPRVLQELCVAVDKARDRPDNASGREPSVAELAERLSRSSKEIMEALQANEGRTAQSLDTPVHDEEHDLVTAGDLIGRIDCEYERAEARATIERLTSILDERARQVLRLRFGHDLRQSEIAERLGCSPMHVSRIIRASLDKMGAHATSGACA